MVKNIENFKYLCENNYITIDNPYKILLNAIRDSLPIESIRELEDFLGIKVVSLLEKRIETAEFNNKLLIVIVIYFLPSKLLLNEKIILIY